MKLDELIVEKKQPDGTYAGVHFSKETVEAIAAYCKENKIPNRTRHEKMHTTVLYSRKYLPDYEPAGKYEKPMIGTPTGFDIWPSKGEDPKNCLVLEYKCPELEKRHEELMKDHEATYDFDEYKTHITFSYDVGDLDIKTLPKFESKIEIVEEYGQDLDLNWADKSTKK
jgi:hypothetical protein